MNVGGGLADDPLTDGSFPAEEAEETAEIPAPVGEWVEALRGVVEHNVRTRPYPTLLVAGAVGYVLAAGVPTVLGRAALSIGGRMLMNRALGAVLSGTGL